MDEQTILKYEEQLTSYAKIGISIIIIILIIFSILFLMFLKNGGLKDKGLLIGLFSFLVIGIMVYITSVLPYNLDIKQHAYETYQGNFYIEDYYYATSSGTYILIRRNDENFSIRYKAPPDLSEIKPNNTYTGEFTIAKNSKVLLEIKVVKDRKTGDGSVC